MSQKNPFIYAHSNDDVVWMSQNTNHLPTTPKIQDAVRRAVDNKEYNKYPFNQGLFGLPEAIKSDLGCPEFELLLTSGGTEALYIAMRAFLKKGHEVITSDPSYFIIHHFIRLSQASCTDLPVYEAPSKYSIEQVKEAINEHSRMILFIDPLNPMGSNYTREEVRAVCDLAQDHDLLIFDDITYRDFADEHHLTTEFAPERTLITYSVSKNCGLAGMRTGALLAPPDLMKEALTYNTNDLSINILGQHAAKAAIETKDEWMPKVVEQSRKNQSIIKETVDEIDGAFLPVYPSMANMFVIDISGTGAEPEKVQDRMLYDHNVFVRAGNYVSKKFGKRFVRTSFTVPEEGVRRFKEAFPRVIDELRER